MAEWEKTTLEKCTDILGDGLHGTPKYTDGGEYAFINGNNLVNGEILIKKDTKRVDYSQYEKYKKPLTNRTLLVSINGTLGNVGMYNSEKIILGKSACYFNVKEFVDKDFIYYVVASPMFRQYLEHSATGTTIKNISLKQMREYEFLLPPIEKQKQISSVLKMIDEKIKNNRRVNENLLQQAQTLFYAWFVEYKPFGGVQPSDWKSISVYDLAEYINGAAFKKHEYADTGLPIIKIAELKNGITESTQHCCVEKDPKYYIKDHDILFSWSGNPETSIDTFVWSMGNAILNQHTFHVVSKYEAPAFTFFLLKYLKPQFTHIASNKQTTGLGHVTVKDLKRLQFCTDRQAIKDFNDLTMPIFEMIYSNCKESQGLSTLRDALLPKLMSGDLDVSALSL